ncbi:Ig-like domain-containing protein [Streptomyces sp. NPDC057460]|uniref:Ig-like domain-containing protein n=1 Tax=Streptomyces sp. NPDC057460 TaxID=3346141 RepID=UPI0036CBD2CA
MPGGAGSPGRNPADRLGCGRPHPADGRTLGEGTPAFAGTGEAGSTVRLTDAGSIACTVTVDAAGWWTCTPVTALAEGERTITATDEAGNTSQGGTITITIAPAARVITTPADDSTLRRCSEHKRLSGSGIRDGRDAEGVPPAHDDGRAAAWHE